MYNLFMVKENLPLGLFEKHRAALGLSDPLMVEDERALFAKLPAPAASAVIFLPKSKALIDMTLSIVSGMVERGGTIVLAGANDAGIRSAKDAYEKNIGPVREKIVGNHSALYVGTNEGRGAGKSVEDFISYAPIASDGTDVEAAVLPGVFSVGQLDEGTKLLLSHIPYDKKSVLDIGSGSGVIGAIYKKKNPESALTLADASPLSVLASKKTLERNGISGTVLESDVFDAIAGRFDLILCNPPFHKGVGTDYTFIERFARGAKPRLAHGGAVYIVANSFLNYEETLQKHIGRTETVANDGKFKVLRSTTAV
jgi:16S rRNA (guanine1207-N2)-methyltransferase